MFMRAIPVCPEMHVTNSVLYSTKEALKKFSWSKRFSFCYLQMLSITTPLITYMFTLALHYMLQTMDRGMDRGAAIFNNLSDHVISALPLPLKLPL